MSSIDNTRLPFWSPPIRPEWVARMNEEGLAHDLKSLVPLDAESLIAYAVRNTGLDNFGDDEWREPFAILLQGLEEEARLTLAGRLLTRSDLILFLEARLRVENAYIQHPEIADEVIERPIFIIGQGRSGTTALQKLLGLPPENRTTTDFDGMFPVHASDEEARAQHAIAEARMTQWARIVPQVAPIHDFKADAPCETIRFEALSFRCPAWLNLLGVTPSFNAYVARTGREISLSYAKRVIKVLQWQRPGKQWVLKSPDALLYLPEVLNLFPDARLVWGHRDPIKAMSSMVDMIGTMMWIRSDQKLSAAYEEITNPALTAPMLSQPIKWLESGAVPKAQLCNVQYLDMVRDPVGTVEKIYAFFGMDFSAAAGAAIQRYTQDHPRAARPAHNYSLGSAEQVSAERAAFQPYQSYFAVPDEQ